MSEWRLFYNLAVILCTKRSLLRALLLQIKQHDVWWSEGWQGLSSSKINKPEVQIVFS
jgi:hypothetical protein